MSSFFKFIFSSLYYYTKYLKLIMGKGFSKEQKQQKQGETLYHFLNSMGPLYIKLGQILSTRSDLIPVPWIAALSKLQDDTIPMKDKALRAWLNKALDRPFEQTFRDFDFTPLASASIAQVHKATLISGELVAVKIVKQNVRSEMRKNLTMISRVINLACLLSKSCQQLELKERFKELAILLEEQTDLVKERKNQQQVYENYHNHRYIIVPQVYPDYSNKSVLIMELMHGIPGKQVDRVKMDRPQLARRLQDSIYTMLYMHGFCHEIGRASCRERVYAPV